MSTPTSETTPCFFEKDPSLTLSRRAFAEGVGSLLLMMAVTGAALTGQRISGGNYELGLVVSALATSGALVGLILAFGSVSGGHFNPLITGLQWLSGQRSLRCALAYIGGQIVGASLGALLANSLFDSLASEPLSVTLTSKWVISEIVATCGLMIVVFGCINGGKALTGPFGVGAWLLAAIVATPSASYANPAITLAAVLASGPVGLTLPSATWYVVAEIAGALLALVIISFAYPRTP
ncbi:aquaporin [Pseudomonas abietaniphila]|uniref:Glycerol uptake facilitator (Major Intrinsic Protein Family) n=1 Tax=Pseudomonas abietaniphila TaxID=89065 RepID=A0A1G8PSX7_9PSED|nr:aquaporin [Pseudomonas abietaniphila]SDI95532.1 Glycerol uptake facilitator (Major Intrinsic Protein Family) [Pseudomonas abietaniphila]